MNIHQLKVTQIWNMKLNEYLRYWSLKVLKSVSVTLYKLQMKLESLKIQKLILKKMMIINDIFKEILNVKCFAIHLILIIYYFISIFNCSDIF